MKNLIRPEILVLSALLLAGYSSSLLAACGIRDSALHAAVLPLQSSALTIGPDASNGTIIYRQHFRPGSPMMIDCDNSAGPDQPAIIGEFSGSGRVSDWSDSTFPAGTVYQTEVPGIGMAVYAWNSTQYTVPFNYPLTSLQQNNDSTWTPQPGIEFDIVLIKTGVIIPGSIGGERLPKVNYNFYSVGQPQVNIGSLSFSGTINIVSRTCTTPDVSVPMGSYEISNTFKSNGSVSPWQDASIKLTGCPRFYGMVGSGVDANGQMIQGRKISNSISVTLSPNTQILDSGLGIMGLRSSKESATGIGIQLAWGEKSDPSPQPVTFGVSRLFTLPDNGAAQQSVPLVARYIQTAPQVTPGKAEATATFTIYYY
ncbi:fimbrial protein [Pantoea sp. BAV 3049]|uniref:fimbrial protein n=1 Tax=Pantoea sp. BAV 3049 TaxID=2654188 RepID=UPI00131EB074|nr:fimbrial protein [Pantoea sp. BAV 3049]